MALTVAIAAVSERRTRFPSVTIKAPRARRNSISDPVSPPFGPIKTRTASTGRVSGLRSTARRLSEVSPSHGTIKVTAGGASASKAASRVTGLVTSGTHTRPDCSAASCTILAQRVWRWPDAPVGPAPRTRSVRSGTKCVTPSSTPFWSTSSNGAASMIDWYRVISTRDSVLGRVTSTTCPAAERGVTSSSSTVHWIPLPSNTPISSPGRILRTRDNWRAMLRGSRSGPSAGGPSGR